MFVIWGHMNSFAIITFIIWACVEYCSVTALVPFSITSVWISLCQTDMKTKQNSTFISANYRDGIVRATDAYTRYPICTKWNLNTVYTKQHCLSNWFNTDKYIIFKRRIIIGHCFNNLYAFNEGEIFKTLFFWNFHDLTLKWPWPWS